MNYKNLNLSSIEVPPLSIRVCDAKMFMHLKIFIKEYGQTKPLMVRQTDGEKIKLISGMYEYICLIELGHTEAMCYDVGNLPSQEANLAAITHNLIQFETDNIELGTQLVELTSHYPIETLYKKIPLSEHKINKLIEYLAYNWDQVSHEEQLKLEERKRKKLTENKSKVQPETPVAETQCFYKRINPNSFLNNY